MSLLEIQNLPFISAVQGGSEMLPSQWKMETLSV